MRVLIDALTAPGDPRGVGRYVRGLAGSLAAAPDARVVVAHGRWHAEFFAPLATRGVELLPIDLRSGSKLARHAWHATRLMPMARRLAADVVHVPDRVPATPVPGLPMVATIHDLAEYDQPEAYGAVQLRYRRLILDRQLGRAHRLVSPSAFSAERLAQIAPAARQRTSVVPNGPGIDPATRPERPVAAPAGPFLLCVGAVQRHKNLPRVIAAFRRMTGTSLALVVAGADHNDRGPLERAWGRDARIVRLPSPSDGELAWLYGHAVALVFPSLYEGFGLPILESMALGCPVITSDRGAMRELGGEATLLVDPLDGSAIQAAMLRLVDDAALGDRLRTAGLARAAAYSWDRAGEGTLAAFRAALDMPAQDRRSLGSWQRPSDLL